MNLKLKTGVGLLLLLAGVLAGVGVAAIDEDARLEVRLLHRHLEKGDVFGAVVRLTVPAAQHDVSVGIAAGAEDADVAVFEHADETVFAQRGGDRIDRRLERSIGGVLKADRHR